MKIVIEDEIKPGEISTEDGGQAKIWTSSAYPPEDDVLDDPGVFFRFQSWDEKGQKHSIFNQFVGKKVRITIESLDPLDQLSEIPKEEP